MKPSRLLSLCVCATLLASACGPALAETRARPAPRRAEPARVLGAFTPSLIDAPGLALKPGATVDGRQFRFTPSGKRGEAHAVTLGLRARAVTLPDATRVGNDPSGYDVGVAVGTRGLAFSGAMRKVDAGIAQRQAVTLGLDYGRHDWSTSLKLGEEEGWARGATPVGFDKRYSVEVGGAYSLGRDVKLGAGVRYRVPAGSAGDADDKNRADRSAFVGLGVAF